MRKLLPVLLLIFSFTACNVDSNTERLADNSDKATEDINRVSQDIDSLTQALINIAGSLKAYEELLARLLEIYAADPNFGSSNDDGNVDIDLSDVDIQDPDDDDDYDF